MNPAKEEFSGTSTSKLSKKNKGEKKAQGNGSQMLFESQEHVLQNISSVFSQSSQSTDVGDFKELLERNIDTEICVNNVDAEESQYFTTYDLRKRFVLKQPKKQSQTSNLAKSPRLNKACSRKTSNAGTGNSSSGRSLGHNGSTLVKTENLETEENSQESVSMLQEFYEEKSRNDFPELMETCLDSELEINYIFSDEEESVTQETSKKPKYGETKVENSTQTNFSVIESDLNDLKEKEIVKHAGFISCVVKLKTLLSSKESVSDKNLWDIMHASFNTEKASFKDAESFYLKEADTHCSPVPKEAIGYVLRASYVQKVFRETVQALLEHLEDALREDILKIAFYWKNSVYEMAVEMLIQAVDFEVGVWKMADLFLCRVIESISDEEDTFKNVILEAKTVFVTKFCQSTHLSYTAINCIIGKLKNLKIITRHAETHPKEKLCWTYLTKNSYFLLRILEDSLKLLENKIKEGKIRDQSKEPKENNYNVLEMWKKHWNQNKVTEKQKTGHQWEVMISKWSEELDEVLLHCVNHVPILSLAVERCGAVAKQILNMCHSEING